MTRRFRQCNMDRGRVHDNWHRRTLSHLRLNAHENSVRIAAWRAAAAVAGIVAGALALIGGGRHAVVVRSNTAANAGVPAYTLTAARLAGRHASGFAAAFALQCDWGLDALAVGRSIRARGSTHCRTRMGARWWIWHRLPKGKLNQHDDAHGNKC